MYHTKTDVSCTVLARVFFRNPKSYYFSVSSSGITQLHMIELSGFQGNILVTDPTRREEDTLLSGESGTK